MIHWHFELLDLEISVNIHSQHSLYNSMEQQVSLYIHNYVRIMGENFQVI